jgi:hypothetical protein
MRQGPGYNRSNASPDVEPIAGDSRSPELINRGPRPLKLSGNRPQPQELIRPATVEAR